MSERLEPIVVRPNPEGRRRAEARENLLVPIYLQSAMDVPHDLRTAALQGIQDTLTASGQQRNIVDFGTMLLPGEYGSTQWYIDQAYKNQTPPLTNYGYGPVLDGSELTRLFYGEPWQGTPHWEVIVINNDIAKSEGSRFSYFMMGVTDARFPAAVISVKRLMDNKFGENRRGMTRWLARHETGHMFGLVQSERGVTGSHCNNDCTMHAVETPEAILWRVKQEKERGTMFCNDCQKDLDERRPRYKSL